MKYEIEARDGVALITHEIKNSLSALKMGMKSLHDKLDGEEREYVDVLLEELKYLHDLTLDTLTLSGPMELDLEQVNMKKLAEESVIIVTGKNNLEETPVLLNFKDDMPAVLCDRNLMKSVLINLIKNAYEEVGDEGKIEVGGKPIDDNMIVFWISDNGEGIKGDVNSLFRKFKSNKKGMGIGLSLVRKVVNEHFGKIEVDSNPGEGTTFEIEMPSDFHFVDRRSGEDRRKSQGRRKEDR